MQRLLLLALLAACGGQSHRHGAIDLAVGPLQRLHVTIPAGKLTLSTAEGVTRVETTADKDVGDVFGHNVSNEQLSIVVGSDADVHVTVPPNLGLKVVAGSAAVRVEGAWRTMDVRTGAGMIDVRATRVAGGSVVSAKGSVAVALEGGPVETLECSSSLGDVSVELASTYRGRIYLKTTTGTIDAPDQKRLRITWEADQKSALAFAGEAFTEKERADELDRYGSPQALRATSASGTVRFRLRQG